MADKTLRDIVQSLLQRPDAVMLDVGAGGELLVAKLRAVLIVLLALSPLVNLATGGPPTESVIALGVTSTAFVFSMLWLSLARQRGRYRWLPFATGAQDVCMISLALLLLGLENPAAGLNSMVTFSIYLLAILMTALRNDGRVTLLTGALSIVQYGLLLWFFVHDAPRGSLASPDYGTVQVSIQLQRLLLLAMATLITAAVVYRMQRLVEMSGTDGLTGLPNRTWLIHRVPRLLSQTRSEGRSLSLALIDLDHFKRINDEIDHQAGDRALRHVAEVLTGRLEHDERLVRLGGEEFVLLLRRPLGGAWERLEVLRAELAGSAFVPERRLPPWPLSFSAGIAAFPHDGQDLTQLLKRADARLQRAKQGGRNRVVARDD